MLVQLGSWASCAVLFAAAPASAQTVLDGDTLRYKAMTVHLWGVDAPEKGQVCADGWPAGQMAELYLAELVKGGTLSCDLKNTPTQERVFAICKVDGQDLGAAMASQGFAWAYLAQSDVYAVQESNAMIAVLGVHAHDCMKAWEWRARRLQLRRPG
jgi:endonuclease YncB( thermonuclease family)